MILLILVLIALVVGTFYWFMSLITQLQRKVDNTEKAHNLLTKRFFQFRTSYLQDLEGDVKSLKVVSNLQDRVDELQAMVRHLMEE